jgi:hypothetical protein
VQSNSSIGSSGASEFGVCVGSTANSYREAAIAMPVPQTCDIVAIVELDVAGLPPGADRLVHAHSLRLARVGIGGLHRRIEFAGIRTLFARAVARAFAAAEGNVIVDAGGRQIDHHHAGLAVALEV